MNVFEKEEIFWRERFDSEDRIIALPYSKKEKNYMSVDTTAHLDSISITLPSKISKRVISMANGSEMAIFLILLSGVNCLLYKYTKEKNIVLGIPTIEAHKEMFPFIDELLPLKAAIHNESTFKSILKEVNLSVNESIKHQNISFKKMIASLNVELDMNNRPVVNTVVALREIHKSITFNDVLVSDSLFNFNLENDLVNLDLFYNKNLYDKDFIDNMLKHFINIFSNVLEKPEIQLNKLELVSDTEKEQILVTFNDVTADYPREKTIHQLFEEQVERTPDHLAVVFEDQQLTYRELNERANQLARTLRAEGIKENQLIGIMLERSIEMIVGMLGILKAGGAYVPVDPEYPEERIQYMLEDSGTKVLLLQSHLQDRVSFKHKIIMLDDSAAYLQEGSNLDAVVKPNDLAYVIYTSGTTGKPKGTLIEHKNVVRLLFNNQNLFDFNANDTWMLFHSFCFDFSVWEMYGALLYGGKLVVVPSLIAKDPEQFRQLIISQGVTILNQTPTYFYQVLQEEMQHDLKELRLRKVIFGGEALSPSLLKGWKEKYPSTQLINMYGITETTVHVTYKEITEVEIEEGKSNIGKPIPTLQAYILDEYQRIQPIGIIGELYVAGDGLARGYLNRPELTAEKFVENPFIPGERMYRTGDLAKWLPDGNIEYIGRIDHQVKIRGYRIEIGEVELQLLKVPSVNEAIVIVREDEVGQKHLCTYFVAEKQLTVNNLRDVLSQELPAYMIPSYFVQLAHMPLTSNGKIDRKALPEPEQNLQIGTEYVAPQTPVEEILVSIWQTVLGVPQIGVLDNFFDLGGDSIKSIQVSSRLYQAGYRVDMKNLFKYSTVASLSPYVEKITRVAEQGEVIGEAKLTPIQHWLFDCKVAAPHHFNQAFMLYRKQGFDVLALRKTMQKIAEHHDALRMVFRQTEQGYEAWNRGIEGELFSLEVMDLTENRNPASAIEATANVLQSSIDLSEGPLMKLGLFKCEEGDHLLIVIHHLVVDGVSWRILLEDIEAGYEQAVSGEAIQLPQKTDSFQLWAEQLSLYTNSPEMEKEREYWNEIEQIPRGLLPKDGEQDCGSIKDSEVITVQWTSAETEQLLKQTNRAYNTEINDLLLTALGRAIHKWTGMENIVVNLEGHGRESILSDLDISRTVGWFTSQYPVVLSIEVGSDISHQIKNIKEELRHIPNKGIGYGLLKYLSENQEKQTFTLKPEISFNYLGQFDQDLDNTTMQPSPYSSGKTENEHHARLYVLDINGMVSGGRLALEIEYSGKQYNKETIEQLAKYLQVSLKEVIEHCVRKERTEITPSDITFKGMTIEELDRVVQKTKHIGEIENVYPLTPMQKGMLFHSLLNSQSEAYFEQVRFNVQGSLNIKGFLQSLEQLAQRHAIFRTNFVNAWNDEPLQIVYRDRKINLHYEDLQEMDELSRKERIEKYTTEDKEKGFNLAEDGLMRMAILRVEEQTYHVIWSFHHILMDGWCMPLVTREIFEIYYAMQGRREPELTVVTPYSEYIEWLEAQNQEEASKYWNDYLTGYEGQTELPKTTSSVRDVKYILKHLTFDLDKELTERLKQVASENQVTINILMQTVWGMLLQKYNSSQDVVFGSVVSGRPADIPGIENMIGLFINTIPVRIHCDAKESFVEVMKKHQKQAVISHAYDTYPLYEIQAQTEQKQDLITHIMVFENYPVEQQMEHRENHNETELTITNVTMTEQTNYDFNVMVIPGEDIKVHFQYNAHMYNDESIERMRNHLIQIMQQVVNDPQIGINELELITVEEKIQILDVFNDTAAEYPCEKTIHQLFEEQVERTPDHIAAVFEGQQLTYRELNLRANQLARTLRNEGVKRDQLVGIMVERSLEMIVGILGILKAGGAYVPVDPEYPKERIQYILEDSGATILLIQDQFQERTSFVGKIVLLDDEESYHKEGTNLKLEVGSNELAYVIYTSGTTGNPKGVMIEHQALVNRIHWMQKRYPIGETDIVLQKTPYSFDVSVWELLWWGAQGAKVVFLAPGGEKDPELIIKAIEENHVTTMHFVPSMLSVFLDYVQNVETLNRTRSLRQVFASGEALQVQHVKRFNKLLGMHNETRLINLYGPTEATIDVSYFDCPLDETLEQVPIGKPIDNVQLYVVDTKGHLQPIGIPGELCIAGVGLARGYLNRPQLTEEKFVDNPFNIGEKMYRTGDLARLLPDGNIEYLGRVDHQVKIRGYRIELGEIESKLLKIDAIQETIVIAMEDENGQKSLCAYFVADKEIDTESIREALSHGLPKYMIPTYFIQLMQMPLTPNGKINRKALPAVEESKLTNNKYVKPRTEIEEQLVNIWKSILGDFKIGIKDNFFDIGGHSLRATTLVSKIRKELKVDIKLREVFQYSTIEQMEKLIVGRKQHAYVSIPKITERGHYPVSSAQKRMYILSQYEGGELSYNMPGVLKIEGELDHVRLEKVFQQLIQRHESLRTSFKMIHGELMQEIHSKVEFQIELVQAKEEDEYIYDFVREFDLQQAPLLRVRLIQLENNHHILLFDMHHIISDGVSMNILMREFVQLYDGKQLPSLQIQYKDYAAWQQNMIHQEQMKKQESYWLDIFKGEIPELELPTDYERPSVRSYEGDVFEFVIDKQSIQGLSNIEAQTGATLYMIMLASYTILLSKYSGQEDIIVGTPIAGRTHADLESVIGMFVNTLAIRNYPSGEKSFDFYLHEVKETMLNAYENQEYPFEELIQKLNIKKDVNRNPLFDTLFVLQNKENTNIKSDLLTFKPYDIQNQTIAKFDLTMYIHFTDDKLIVSFEYCTKLFKKSMIEILAKDFSTILSTVAKDPRIQLGNIKLVEEIENETELDSIELTF
ncbi:amino acid adenylation domain-containing protein [Bacillus cereus group sp. MYBK5-2]|uniref:amino acid adenylation domain-containing protein n=1 Tax=Bacillus cereus group sp. MYBK5-2 TaxID=3450622 RepID=UPI003F79876C